MGALKSLRQSVAWGVLADAIRAQYGTRVAEIVGSDESTRDGMLRREFLRGEARAFVTCLRLPEILIETAQGDLDVKLKLEEIANDGRSSSTSSNPGGIGDTNTDGQSHHEPVTSGDWSDDK